MEIHSESRKGLEVDKDIVNRRVVIRGTTRVKHCTFAKTLDPV